MSSSETKPSRAFIIGDRDKGLTIVITDPVMVVHYSNADLQNAGINQMNDAEPIVSMGAIVQELVPYLRGVKVDALRDRENEIRQQPHGAFSLDEEEAVFAELDYARTIGQLIRNKSTVCDVDFCVAMDIEPCDILSLGGRITGPASSITSYLNQFSDCKDSSPKTVSTKPQVFNITNLPSEPPLDPWKDPRPQTP